MHTISRVDEPFIVPRFEILAIFGFVGTAYELVTEMRVFQFVKRIEIILRGRLILDSVFEILLNDKAFELG